VRGDAGKEGVRTKLVRLPLNREEDSSFHDAIEESHGERAIREIVSPFLEVHAGSERSGALLLHLSGMSLDGPRKSPASVKKPGVLLLFGFTVSSQSLTRTEQVLC